MDYHPDYSEEPLDPDLRREHTLHRIVAASAFLFALCILPVAQYFLVQGHSEGGEVAGVSTSVPATVEPTALGVVPAEDLTVNTSDCQVSADLTGQLCIDDREKKLANLETFRLGMTNSISSKYQSATNEGQVDDQSFQVTRDKLSALDKAVSQCRQEILAHICQ